MGRAKSSTYWTTCALALQFLACSSTPVQENDPNQPSDAGTTSDGQPVDPAPDAPTDASANDSAADALDASAPDATTPDADATVADASDAATSDATVDASSPDAPPDAPVDAKADATPDAKTCVDKCTLSTQQCAGNGYTTCQLQPSGCTDWGATTNCASNEYCSSGQCITSCLNQCTSGVSKCASTTSISACAVQSNGCTEWNTATACPPSQACVNGACKASTPSLGWKSATSSTQQQLNAVWGAAYNDVFAVGNAGTIVHYDGNVWSPMASGTVQNLSSVWGSGPKDVWAVGSSGDIRHYDGSKWALAKSDNSARFYGVTGTSSSDVWVADSYGTVHQWNGSSWTKHYSGLSNSTDYIAPIASNGPGRVWATGSNWSVAKYDGSTWTKATAISAFNAPRAILNVGQDKFWIGGYMGLAYCDGTCNPATPPNSNIWTGFARVTDTDVWMVGGGTIARFNGQGWVISNTSTTNYYGIWASGPDDAWAVGEKGTVMHYTP